MVARMISNLTLVVSAILLRSGSVASTSVDGATERIRTPRGLRAASGINARPFGRVKRQAEKPDRRPMDFPSGFSVPESASRLAECPADADWIIVGGGAAGCAAAAVMADGGLDVLLLERGPSDYQVPSTQSALTWPKVVNEASQALRFKEGVWGAVANVLGGGSSLNAGLFLADSREFFEQNLPFDPDMVMSSYEMLQLELATPLQPTNFSSVWNDTLNETGYGFAENTPQLVWTPNKPFHAYSTFNTSDESERRTGSAALVHNRAHLENLRVLTRALVSRIKIDADTKEAYGVEVKVGEGESARVCNHVGAKVGVIVSAGAIFTPQLLQISGIGPQDLLDQLGVPVILDLPVGQNFVDRIVQMIAPLSPVHVPFQTGYTVVVDTEKGLTLENTGGGDISVQLGISTAALVPPENRTQKVKDELETIFNLLPEEIRYLINNMNEFVCLLSDTHSRGWVNATSTDVETPPEVAANYFADNRDWVNRHTQFQQLLKMADTQAMDGHVWDRISFPFPDALLDIIYAVNPLLADIFGCFIKTDNNHAYPHVTLPCMPQPFFDPTAVEKYLWDTMLSSYHYFGTAAVGVVTEGSDLKVKGTRNLHVVDASVFPRPTNVNPQASIMALGHVVGRHLSAEHR